LEWSADGNDFEQRNLVRLVAHAVLAGPVAERGAAAPALERAIL
jgi:hypothetical protein